MNWEADNASRLTRRWNEVGGRLVLPGACPGCGHAGAFSHIVVDKQGPIPGVLADQAPPGVGGFPSVAFVDCACKHPSHKDQDGCGRAGDVRTQS